ncbi:response regulator transcription factor [Shouchella shacheensis]|uniref:response regulator transcription factor n=1 Tax=Shouchella shacheensis TaxID=1649580 RepID=UPI0007404EE8|nr:response regulator transcription factor [Shouchella shacheensis]
MRVLLVDDEPIILQGLQAIIDWKALGCELIGTASNGDEALRRYSDDPCDLIITDIRMPQKGGLALIEGWQEVQPRTRFLVLSGYQDFSYVRQGLVLGIENYLLKPVNEQELIESIEQVREKVQAIHQQQANQYILRDNTIWRWLHDRIEKTEFLDRMALSEALVPEGRECLALLSFVNANSLPNGVLLELQQQLEQEGLGRKLHCIITPEQDLLLLYKPGEEEKAFLSNIQSLIAERIKQSYVLFISSDCLSKEDLQYDLKVATAYRDQYLFFNETHVIDKKEAEKKQRESGKSLLLKLEPFLKIVHEGKREEAILWLKGAIVTRAKDETAFKSMAMEAAIALTKMTSREQDPHYPIIMDDLLAAPTVEDLWTELELLIENTILQLSSKQEVKNTLINDVLAYIEREYMNDLSLKVLGQTFYMNAIYLGQLFQKEVGVSFSDYVNRLRLDQAKRLLLTTNEKAGAIGKKVGYSDATYFYKQFKKQMGITPNEYRTITKLSNAKDH